MAMSDLCGCCTAELKEVIEKAKLEFEQSLTKKSDLDAKIKEEENTRLVRDLKEVSETNNDALNINSLPNEIILEVFRYLRQNQLGRIASVCQRWNVLTKSPVLWKKVRIFSCRKFNIIESFINRLPSCVISVRLDFVNCDDSTEPNDFEELCLKLQENCPNLEELILNGYVLSNDLSSAVDICTEFLQHVKNLVFIDSLFYDCSARREYFGISKIENLVLHYCFFDRSNESSSGVFSKMPHLQQLHLYGTNIHDSYFEDDASFLNQLHILNVGRTHINSRMFSTIQNHGHNLEKLYLCLADLRNQDLNFTNSVFPHLKTICLRNTNVTCEGVVSLIQSCPSLENVYVDEIMAVCSATHAFFVANKCKAGIVKAIGKIHMHDVEYLHN